MKFRRNCKFASPFAASTVVFDLVIVSGLGSEAKIFQRFLLFHRYWEENLLCNSCTNPNLKSRFYGRQGQEIDKQCVGLLRFCSLE